MFRCWRKPKSLPYQEEPEKTLPYWEEPEKTLSYREEPEKTLSYRAVREKLTPFNGKEWPQVVHSIISGSPPRGMSPKYYYCASPVSPARLLTEVEYQRHIMARMISNTHFEVVQGNENQNQQEIEHIRDPIRSATDEYVQANDQYKNRKGKKLKANDHENRQGIEHIRSPERSASATYDEFLQTNDQHKYQKWIKLKAIWMKLKANDHENRQGIEHIQTPVRSASATYDEFLQTNDQHENQNWMKLKANDHKNRQGIEQIQSPMRSASATYDEFVQTNIQHKDQEWMKLKANNHENQQGIEHIRSPMTSASATYDEFVQANDQHKNQIVQANTQVKVISIEHMLYPSEIVDLHMIDYMQAKTLSTLFSDTLKTIENFQQLDDQPIPRLEVLQVLKLLFHLRIDLINSEVRKDLEVLNKHYDVIERDSIIHYKKESLELMLKILEILREHSIFLLCDIINKAEQTRLAESY